MANPPPTQSISPRTWDEWRAWAEDLVLTHTEDQVADTLADMGADMTAMREGYCSEAYIVMVQTLDVKALSKSRRRVLSQQARRMAGVGLAQERPRAAGTAVRARELAEDVLAQVEDPDAD